jgi:hypothetical protein
MTQGRVEYKFTIPQSTLKGESRPCGYRITMQSMGERERAASVPVGDGITKADLSSYIKNSTFSFILSNTCFLLAYAASDSLLDILSRGLYKELNTQHKCIPRQHRVGLVMVT